MTEAKEQLGTTLLPDVPIRMANADGRDGNCSQQRRKELRSNPERDSKVCLRAYF